MSITPPRYSLTHLLTHSPNHLLTYKVTKEMLMRVLEENQSTKNMKKLWYSANEANNLARDT